MLDEVRMMRVVEIDAQDDPRWEAFVTSHPDGLIYHHPAWLLVLEREYGIKPTNLACEDATGKIRGVLPMFHTRGLPFRKRERLSGHRLSSLPRTPVAGPLTLDTEATAILIQAAVDRIKKNPDQTLQVKVPRPILDGLVEGVVNVPWRLTYVLELPAESSTLRFGNGRNHSRIKWAINKASRLGVEVREAETEDDLKAWYTLYLETQRESAVPPRAYRFFKACWDVLRPRGLMRLLMADRNDAGCRRFIAGSIFLMFGKTVFYAFNGASRNSLALRPNDAIQWRAIHQACDEGYRWFDFGEVDENNEGLADFKSKWGAQPQRLFRYYYSAALESGQSELNTASGRTSFAKMLTSIWKRLPLGVTAIAGDWIYRYL
jgi:CelD/BcsL family acetyltransferase involved in cellulose biosynthesis